MPASCESVDERSESVDEQYFPLMPFIILYEVIKLSY